MSSKPTAAQIKARLKNPGERAKLDVKYLTPAQRAQREMNQRLAAPVTPGSTLTNRDLSHQRSAAVKVQYGPAEQGLQGQINASKQTEQDAAGWFDMYQKDLLAHAQAVGANGQQTTQNLTGLTTAAGGLNAPGGQGTPDDANAARVRSALIASFGALANQTGANANTYADTQARVVAPGQKLTGLLAARKNTMSVADKLSALKREQGAYADKFTSDTIANEAKNVLAQQALTGKTAAEQTSAALKAAGLSETVRSHKASERISSQTAKQKAAADAAKVNEYGYTSKDWAALSTGERQKVIKDFKRTGGKKSGGGKGPDWVTPSQASAFQTDFDRAKAYAKQLLSDPKVSRAQVAAALQATSKPQTLYDPKTGKPKLNADGTKASTGSWSGVSSAVTSAAIDAAQSGHLSAYTVRKLIAAGIKPSSLGIPTAGQSRRGVGSYSKGSGRPD